MPIRIPTIRQGLGAPTGAVVIRALPPPPPTSAGPRTAQFADLFAAQQAEIVSKMPTPAKELGAELMNLLRRTNITAGLPAHIRPPVWNDPIDLSATVTVPAAVGPYVTAVSFTVPAGHWARIEQYGVNVLDPSYTYDGSILWAMRVNGRMLDQGMSDWGEQRGTMIFPRKTTFLAYEEQNIDMMVRRAVAAGGAQDVQMGFRGWTWRLRNNYECTQASVVTY